MTLKLRHGWKIALLPLLLVATSKATAVIPGSSPFVVEGMNGTQTAICPVQQSLKFSPVAGDENHVQTRVALPTQTLTISLERRGNRKVVQVSTSQGHVLNFKSEAPLSTAQIWLTNLDTNNSGQAEIIVTLPETQPNAQTPIPYSLLVLSQHESAPNPWRLYPLKTVTVNPQQDIVRLGEGGDCAVITAEPVKVENNAYWFYRGYRDSALQDLGNFGSSQFPLYLPQAGSEAQKCTPLNRPMGDRILGRFIDQAPLNVKVFSHLDRSNPAARQILVTDEQGKRLRLLLGNTAWKCTNDTSKGGYSANFDAPGYFSDLHFEYSDDTELEIYGLQPLEGGRYTADLVVRKTACPAEPSWGS